MAYPVSYRHSARRGPQGRLRTFLRDESGFLRFPDGPARWANRRIGDLPVLPSRRYVVPPPPETLIPPDPATRRQQDIPWFERARGFSRALGLIGLGLTIYDQVTGYWPSGQFRNALTVAPGAGWNHICGPTPWPGPPYANALKSFYRNSVGTTPFCGLGGQIFNLPVIPSTTTRAIFNVWGPNLPLKQMGLLRWYVAEQWNKPLPAQAFPKALTQFPRTLPQELVTRAPPGVFYNVVPSSHPFALLRSNPRQQVAGNPYQSVAASPSARVVVRVAVEPGGLSYRPSYPDVRPPPRERERKTSGKLGVAFKVLSQIGSWNSVVSAFWYALPRSARGDSRLIHNKLRDLYQHYDEIDLRRAVENALRYWLGYKAAGYAYGRSYQALVKRFGVNEGTRIYRGLASLGLH